jgi:hypothetical protein
VRLSAESQEPQHGPLGCLAIADSRRARQHHRGSPSAACAGGATPYRRRQMREARNKLRLCSQSARRRGRVLRFQAWPDGRRPERNRAASDPRLCLLVELARRRTHAQVQVQRSRMGRCRLSPAFSHEQPPLARVAFRTSAPRIERARTKRRRSRDDSNATGRARSTAHGWGDRAYLKPAPDENCGHERGGHPHTHDAQGLTDESIKFRTADSPGTVIPRGRLLRRADP